MMADGTPYRTVGGIPSPQPDVGINITFLILFTICAVLHFETFWRNKKQQRLFAFNAATTAFCFTRIIAASLRIGWSYDPHNISLAAAAQIFVYTGIIILILCNVWWSQRILRAQHPSFGWRLLPTYAIPVIVGLSIVTVLLMTISTCLAAHLPAASAQHVARGIQQYAAVLFAVLAVVPIPILLTSALAKTHPDLKDRNEDNFGRHSITRKAIVCLATATLLSIGALFRATISFAPQMPAGDAATPWYFSKACFYVFNFTLEILVVMFWMFVRIDKLFIVPNSAWGPHSYGGGFLFAGENGNEKPSMATHSREPGVPAVYRSEALSTRSSTIPPPTRAGSWGSARRYMCASPSPCASPQLDAESSWGGASHTRVDSAWGDDSRTGGTYTTKASLDLQRPPCVRCCATCGSHEDLHMNNNNNNTNTNNTNNTTPSYPAVAYKQMFDPRQGRWVQRQMSLSGPSVSQYSVRETLRPVSTIASRISEDASPGSFLGWNR